MTKAEKYSDTRRKNNNFFTQVPKSQVEIDDQQGVRFRRKKKSMVDQVEKFLQEDEKKPKSAVNGPASQVKSNTTENYMKTNYRT